MVQASRREAPSDRHVPDEAIPGHGDAVGATVPPRRDRVVRILNGPHTDAESVFRSERLLVGNLESECDLVLDVGRAERHVCLMRVSDDGWTVLAVAGDLWVEQDYLPPQQTREISAGKVLTLGRVAFAVGMADTTDWGALAIPTELHRPEAAGDVPSLPMIADRAHVRQRWNAMRVSAGLAFGVLLLSSAIAYVTMAMKNPQITPQTAAQRLHAEKVSVAAQPYGKEVELQPGAESNSRVLVRGYVPSKDDLDKLAALIRESGNEPDLQVQPVDELGKDIGRRFALADGKGLRYDKDGHFIVETRSELIDAHDRDARLAMQELPALQGLALSVDDVRDGAGQPVVVHYARAPERPGELVVTDLDTAKQRLRYVVREIRLGTLPSIVLDNGARYFEGATLPDGASLKSIEAQAVVIKVGDAERRIVLPDPTHVNATDDEKSSQMPSKRMASTLDAHRPKGR